MKNAVKDCAVSMFKMGPFGAFMVMLPPAIAIGGVIAVYQSHLQKEFKTRTEAIVTEVKAILASPDRETKIGEAFIVPDSKQLSESKEYVQTRFKIENTYISRSGKNLCATVSWSDAQGEGKEFMPCVSTPSDLSVQFSNMPEGADMKGIGAIASPLDPVRAITIDSILE